MYNIREPSMPVNVAPHANELWAAEVAGGHGHPAACGGGLAHANLAQIHDPIPIQQRPVLKRDQAPALGCDERLVHGS